MPTVETSGTLVATAAEQNLAALTSNRNWILVVDANAMVAGDVMILRLKREALSGGTKRTVYEQTFTGVQGTPILISVPMPGPYGVTATLQQPEGTGRSFPWSLESL